MTRLNISLPEPLRQFVDDKVKSGGYGTASEYIGELIRQAQNAEEEQVRLEALLLEGLDSGPGTEVTPEFWKELRPGLVEWDSAAACSGP
jgi:antitoxin ParD1/3/4